MEAGIVVHSRSQSSSRSELRCPNVSISNLFLAKQNRPNVDAISDIAFNKRHIAQLPSQRCDILLWDESASLYWCREVHHEQNNAHSVRGVPRNDWQSSWNPLCRDITRRTWAIQEDWNNLRKDTEAGWRNPQITLVARGRIWRKWRLVERASKREVIQVQCD